MFDDCLSSAHCIIEIVLRSHHLQRVVPDEPGSELFLIEFNEPVDELAVDPALIGVHSEKVRRSATHCIRDHRFLLIGVHDFLIVAHCDLGVRPQLIVSSLSLAGLGRHKYLLHAVHEGAKD